VVPARKEPHHIASVADLFLGINAGRAAVEVPVSPVTLTFAVAAATSDSFSQWTAGQLRCATGAAAGGAGGLVPEIRWRHLGRTSLRRLRAGETAKPPRIRGRPPVGCDGLIWCLEASEADTWWAAYRLGRLVRVLRPAQVKVLIRGGPGDLDPWAGSRVSLCAERCLAAAPGCPQEVLLLPASALADTQATSETCVPAEFLGRLSGSLKLAALDLRCRCRGTGDKLLGEVAGKG
jgi:hypothetical protein